MRTLILVVLASALSGAAWGQAQPVVRVEIKPESVVVGEPAELSVTVLVPTWFTRPPVYPPFELANAMTRLPADSSYPIRERVGTESWSGIVRTYEIYPMLGANYRMAGQTITVTFANPGSGSFTVDVEVPEIVLRGVVPEGAESLDPYIAGRNLSLSLGVEGELDELEAGDAIVLTYKAELDGLPAIFLPPLAPDFDIDGVSIYRNLPEVRDEGIATRTEKVTLVFDVGGEFNIPGMNLSFWNAESGSIEAATADGIDIFVEGPPAVSTAEEESGETRWQSIAGIAAAALAMMLALWRWLPALARRYREAATRRRQTEGFAFRQLSTALGSADNEAAYHALLCWIERLEPEMDARTFAARYGNHSLSREITLLSAGLYGVAGDAADLGQVRHQLRAARGRFLATGAVSNKPQLPPLNP